jgi:hypothetical protein
VSAFQQRIIRELIAWRKMGTDTGNQRGP